MCQSAGRLPVSHSVKFRLGRATLIDKESGPDKDKGMFYLLEDNSIAVQQTYRAMTITFRCLVWSLTVWIQLL
jgi:hypothetical protein